MIERNPVIFPLDEYPAKREIQWEFWILPDGIKMWKNQPYGRCYRFCMIVYKKIIDEL